MILHSIYQNCYLSWIESYNLMISCQNNDIQKKLTKQSSQILRAFVHVLNWANTCGAIIFHSQLISFIFKWKLKKIEPFLQEVFDCISNKINTMVQNTVHE